MAGEGIAASLLPFPKIQMIMAKFEKIKITLDDSTTADAVAPEIISASRRTDIPAFYAGWFFDRLKKGYVDWTNPFSQQTQHVSFRKTKFIVFWTKNPGPIIEYLPILDEMGIDFYFQYTFNSYPWLYEPRVPSVSERAESYKEIVKNYGRERVIWRYDPLFLVDGEVTLDDLYHNIIKVYNCCGRLSRKLIISFADIKKYNKVAYNLKDTRARELTEDEEDELAARLHDFFEGKGIEVCTCSEDRDLSRNGIKHNACIDASLIAELTRDKEFAFRVQTIGKDTGQRPCCLCTLAKDIGIYNTCAHGCKYCYANVTPAMALENFEKASKEPYKSTLL